MRSYSIGLESIMQYNADFQEVSDKYYFSNMIPLTATKIGKCNSSSKEHLRNPKTQKRFLFRSRTNYFCQKMNSIS